MNVVQLSDIIVSRTTTVADGHSAQLEDDEKDNNGNWRVVVSNNNNSNNGNNNPGSIIKHKSTRRFVLFLLLRDILFGLLKAVLRGDRTRLLVIVK